MQESEKESNWLLRLLKYVKKGKGKIATSIIVGIIGIVSGLVPYYAVAQILVQVWNQNLSLGSLTLYCVLAGAGYLVKHIFHSISTLLSHDVAFEILKNLRLSIAEKLRKLPLGYVLEHSSGELKNILVDEVERLELPLAHIIPEFTSNVIAPICIFFYLCCLDWRMALASLLTFPIGGYCYYKMLSNYKEKYQKYSDADNRMNGTIVEYVNGIEVIRMFNQGERSFQKFSEAVISFRDYTLAWYRYNWPFTSAAFSIMPTVLVSVLPIGGYFCMIGSLSVDSYITSLILAMSLVGPISRITELIDNVSVLKQSEKKIFQVSTAQELPDTGQIRTLAGRQFEFRGVSFSYGGAEVLHNISFCTGPNQTTAFVGPSGSGKSTIARLMARFWDVGRGQVLMDGIDVREIPLDNLMQCISYVTQDNFLYNFSILENIRIGRPNATDEEVIEAAKQASCHEFILQLEKGYHTLAGEAGNRLSGGERQRIAIARAILKDAPIVILDEATAFTDPENEAHIQKSLRYLTKGKTLILIAHRLPTVIYADQIIVMNQGKVDSRGTHEELLQSSQLYRTMWNTYIQAIEWEAKEAVTC